MEHFYLPTTPKELQMDLYCKCSSWSIGLNSYSNQIIKIRVACLEISPSKTYEQLIEATDAWLYLKSCIRKL